MSKWFEEMFINEAKAVLPKCNGNRGMSIIESLSLPTENIVDGSIYKVLVGKWMNGTTPMNNTAVHCVESLPEIGQEAHDSLIGFTNVYYNTVDREVYCYFDKWYPAHTFCSMLSGAKRFGGVIYETSRIHNDDYYYLLLRYEYYIHSGHQWTKLMMPVELVPEFRIDWDGIPRDRFTLDMGFVNPAYSGYTAVKLSEKVLSIEELRNATLHIVYDSEMHSLNICEFLEGPEYEYSMFPGSINIGVYIIVVQNADMLCSALGLPEGYLSNGTYFVSFSYDDGGTMYPCCLMVGKSIYQNEEIFLTSPHGTKFRITVSDDGVLSATPASE